MVSSGNRNRQLLKLQDFNPKYVQEVLNYVCIMFLLLYLVEMSDDC